MKITLEISDVMYDDAQKTAIKREKMFEDMIREFVKLGIVYYNIRDKGGVFYYSETPHSNFIELIED